jgi:transcription antitermination protein NusB
MKNARRRAREFALQALYQWQVAAPTVSDAEKNIAELEGFAKADAAFFSTLVRGATLEHDALAAQFAPHLDRTWAEVSPIERGIMLLGGYELNHMVQTPYRVIINEAIELAKAFGGTDGHKYVNGVLDKVAAIVRAEEIKYQAENPDPANAGAAGKKPAKRGAKRDAAVTVKTKARKVVKP